MAYFAYPFPIAIEKEKTSMELYAFTYKTYMGNIIIF